MDKADIFAVAKAAGVSISTVSRSFNHPDLVKPATRKKIDRAVRRLGYIRNRAAQTMHGKRSGTIGLVVPTIDHAIFGEVTQSFSDAVDDAGFTILMASHGFDLDREYTILRKFLEHRVDGLAVIGLDHSDAAFQLIAQQAIPTILIWNYNPRSQLPCVGADNIEAGRMVARHLIKLGHRAIATVFPQTHDNDRARDRKIGAMDVLKQAGITVPSDWQSESPYSIAEAKQACSTIMTRKNRPTAILCGNDVIAQGALFAAQMNNISVPDDLSIIGIGDFKGSQEIEPALTSVRIPALEIGRIAGQKIVGMIGNNELTTDSHKCDLRIRLRKSTRQMNIRS